MALCYTRAVKRTTIWLNQRDREAIETIRTRYGQESDSAAIRFALRVLASQELRIQDADNQGTQDQNQPHA